MKDKNSATGVKNPKVDGFLKSAEKWQGEMTELRKTAFDSGLTEELKWGVPTYTLNGNNVILIHAFKEYCAVLFVKGALLKDPKHVMVQQTENVQASRQVRFTNIKDVIKLKPALKALVKEAIEAEKAGLQVKFKKTAEFNIPDEFKDMLDKNSALKAAFYKLTPGRQRGYLLFFSSAKQPETRVSRIEKSMDKIFDGKGLND
jgi:uncharacterized protein YdeI (YjbR/CyaY-like superfamily)